MLKTALMILALLTITATGFADSFTLQNQTSYPMKDQKSKIAVQWATSVKEVEQNNIALMHGQKINPDTLKMLTKSGKTNLNIPKNVEFFRVLVWSKGQNEPDLHTNWIEIVPNKTYTLETDHLVPTVLMSGSGC